MSSKCERSALLLSTLPLHENWLRRFVALLFVHFSFINCVATVFMMIVVYFSFSLHDCVAAKPANCCAMTVFRFLPASAALGRAGYILCRLSWLNAYDQMKKHAVASSLAKLLFLLAPKFKNVLTQPKWSQTTDQNHRPCQPRQLK